MAGGAHEIRDPIHVFVRLDDAEREVLDSAPLQRLRHIHQLALTYLVYPGATHKRFEHSLGVMELASRVFDVVTNPANLSDEIRKLLKPLTIPDELRYWRRVLRMAALCHDAGHLPFSHAGERDLLPPDWDHERLTRLIISSEEMKQIWESVTPPLRAQDIEKVAVGPRKAKNLHFSDWEAILADIIVGDAFGADRIDYLLRDSYHAGVAYGRFDHYRLIDTLRILMPPQSDVGNSSSEPSLGVEEDGIQSVEALMIARYFMYSQVYFHRTRRIYDIHLTDYLKEWLDDGLFPTALDKFLAITDIEVIASLRDAARDSNSNGQQHAQRIIRREHFKRLYSANPSDRRVNLESGRALAEGLGAEFGNENFRHDHLAHQSDGPDFPVRTHDDITLSSLAVSEALKHLPPIPLDYIFVDRTVEQKAKKWLEENRHNAIKPKKEHIDE